LRICQQRLETRISPRRFKRVETGLKPGAVKLPWVNWIQLVQPHHSSEATPMASPGVGAPVTLRVPLGRPLRRLGGLTVAAGVAGCSPPPPRLPVSATAFFVLVLALAFGFDLGFNCKEEIPPCSSADAPPPPPPAPPLAEPPSVLEAAARTTEAARLPTAREEAPKSLVEMIAVAPRCRCCRAVALLFT
jgi:hypothetical protein